METRPLVWSLPRLPGLAHIACFIKFVSAAPSKRRRPAFYFTNSIHLLFLSVNRSFGFGNFCHISKITRRFNDRPPLCGRSFREKYDPSAPNISAVRFSVFVPGSEIKSPLDATGILPVVSANGRTFFQRRRRMGSKIRPARAACVLTPV